MKRELKKYITLNILAMTGTSCYILADTFFISMAEGAGGITALNLVLPIYGIIYAIGSMVGIGSATRYTLEKSVGDRGADDYFSNSIWFSLLLSIPFLVSGVLFPDRILSLLGADEQILGIGLSYIRIVLCCAPFFMVNYTFTAFARNDSAPRLAMLATLGSGIFNIIFDYILMFPLDMGMAGAALATGISPLVSVIICLCHYLSKNNTVVFSRKMPSVKKLLSACGLGIAAFVSELSSGITTLVFNFILLGLAGNLAVASYGVIANIALVASALFNGISLGLQPVASSAHGRTDPWEEKKIYRYSLKIGLAIAVLSIIAVMLFGDAFIRIFNSGQSRELAAYASVGVRLYFLGFLVSAVNVIKSGFYSAIGKGRESSVIAVSRGIVTITLMAFLLSKVFGVVGVWLAFGASETITWLLSIVMEKAFRKKAQGS